MVLHFGSFGLEGPIVTDVRYFVYYSWQVSEGAVPHLDFFENKPQLSVFVAAAAIRVGGWLGADPLAAIRVSQLLLAGLAAWLSFVVFRRLGGVVAGFVGLAAAVSFGLLGALPAVGTLPKLLMMVLATSAALLAHDRRWVWAGFAGGLAFFDWQVGAVAWLAVAIAALVDARASAFARVCAGGGLAVLPFAAYYALHGTLAAAFDQVILATFARGVSAVGTRSLAERALRIGELVRDGCPGHDWLFYAGALGIPVAVGWLVRGRADPRHRLLLPLCLFHAALLGMSALETQGFGDFFALLHVAAFGLGLAGWALLERTKERVGWAPVALAALALVVARPGPLRPEIGLASGGIERDTTLEDQREVARAASAQIGGASIGVFDSSELLFLMRRRNAFPSLYWNRATRSHFHEASDATPTATVVRLIEEADPAYFVAPRRVGDRARVIEGTRSVALRSTSGRYAVELRAR